MSAKAIKSIYKGLQKNKKFPNHMFDINPTQNPYEHDLTIIGPNDTIFEQGIFYGKIVYPKNFPFSPPKVYIFDSNKYNKGLFHPNIYNTGLCCISILHEGKDDTGYESSDIRWSPAQTIESIILSIISILDSPNIDSPANVDAAKMYNNNINKYKNIIKSVVYKSQL